MLFTTMPLNGNLCLPLPHAAGGIGVPELLGVSRFTAVFLCAKSQFIIMSNWVGSRKTDWFRVSSTPTYPVRLHNWRYVVGFKNSNSEAIMPKFHAQKPSIKELALIEASTTLSSIAESNAQFTSGFASYLDSLDKHLSEITVFELIDLLNKYRAIFNSKKPHTPKTSCFNVGDKS